MWSSSQLTVEKRSHNRQKISPYSRRIKDVRGRHSHQATLIRKITLSAQQLESSLPGTKTKGSDLTKENTATG